MSETGKTVSWIVVGIAVAAVIVWLFVSAGRRRAAEARRLQEQKQEQRGRAEAHLPEPRGAGARTTVAAPPADAAAARGTQPVSDSPAGGHMEVREAESRRLQQEDEQRRLAQTAGVGGATAAGAAAGAGASAAVGSAAFTQDDEEDDLADAENPFAADGARAVGTGHDDTHSEERPTSVTQHPAPETNETASTGTTVSDAETADSAAADTAAADSAAADAPGTSGAAPARAPKPRAATIDEPKKVEVPALAGRDEFVAGGGTPASDPGDHRGQPWATTPGEQGPGDSDSPADDGLDVDMAPHSHASDEVDETAEAVDPERDTARREEAAPAPDTAAAAYPDEDALAADDSGRAEQPHAERRTSSFDEVVDGGFGLGSAAPIADGAQPLGHAVKALRDGKTFVAPGDAGYDDVDPDVWFYNEDAARRAGFDRQGE